MMSALERVWIFAPAMRLPIASEPEHFAHTDTPLRCSGVAKPQRMRFSHSPPQFVRRIAWVKNALPLPNPGGMLG